MKKKLDTRFPAARIKKIMQSDEDVGKIAMAVPLLVSKALELFLQDLCDRTYGITLERGAKTVSSFHLKQCVQSFNVFDFLKDVVRKVPDLGGASAGGDEHALGKRRKVENEDHNNDEPSSGRILHPAVNNSSNGRGCARGRGRGRPRGRPRASESRAPARANKYEDDPDLAEPMDTNKKTEAPVRNFDLNVGLDDNGDSSTNIISSGVMMKEQPGWRLGEEDDMAIDPVQLASLNRTIDEDDDYDDEG